jgi:hypothetical protein
MPKETISLKCFFTNEEKLKIADEFAQRQQTLNSLEEQKKSVMSDFGSRISIVKEQINMNATKLTNGYESRDIDCIVEYHRPVTNRKMITRSDTGEVFEEPMTQWDYHLFNQEVSADNAPEESTALFLEHDEKYEEVDNVIELIEGAKKSKRSKKDS